MKPTTTATANPFTDLLRQYETDHIVGNDTTDSLTALAKACTFSVLKKLYSVSGQQTVKSLSVSIVRDYADIDRLLYSVDHATKTVYNEEGDRQTVIADSELNTAAANLAKMAMGDGIDLVHTAIVAILEQTAKVDSKKVGFMETPYTVRRLKRKVYIQTADSVNGWEEVETMPIREVYRFIRRAVSASRAIQIASEKYSYIEDLTVDPVSGEEEEIFRRLPMFSTLGGDVHEKHNGRPHSVVDNYTTIDSDTVERVDRIIADLDLSDRQATVLRYRMSGHGNKAIATALGIQERLVSRTLKQIQVKLWDMGIHPEDMTDRPVVK
ncbi:MAG: hypothetical protein IKY16_06425 [Bacteroidales bacterium]|nr:hypothetical protein [Bacteroidales bacterium]